jgi:hypothetical protein
LLPVSKEVTAHENTQFVKEFISSSGICPRLPVIFIGNVQKRMHLKSQKIQQAKHLAGMGFSVPKIMFKVVPVILQYVVMFVFYLPARAGA